MQEPRVTDRRAAVQEERESFPVHGPNGEKLGDMTLAAIQPLERPNGPTAEDRQVVAEMEQKLGIPAIEVFDPRELNKEQELLRDLAGEGVYPDPAKPGETSDERRKRVLAAAEPFMWPDRALYRNAAGRLIPPPPEDARVGDERVTAEQLSVVQYIVARNERALQRKAGLGGPLKTRAYRKRERNVPAGYALRVLHMFDLCIADAFWKPYRKRERRAARK